MPLILSIVLGISYVRRTRIKLHFRIQYVFHKSKKQTSEMQWQNHSFFKVVADSNFVKTKLPNKWKRAGK